MKRWHVIALVAAVVAVGAYFYFYRGFRPFASHSGSTGSAGGSADGRPAQIQWQQISRPDEGFRVDMPADPKETQVPAYNETGGSEPIRMLYSSADADTVFALTWADNPPVARVNHRLAEPVLDQARDGMLARTQTTQVRESRNSASAGYPSRDVTAKNSGGGIIDARFIFINDRLYTLMALYPSMSARREQDVIRFFNSFTTLHPDTNLQPASPNGV